MRAFIIVYSETRFTLSKGLEAHRFKADSGQTWDESEAVKPEEAFSPGVYGVLTDLTLDESSIVAEGAAPDEYDIVLLSDKDGWPDPKLAAWVRKNEKFPEAKDSQLQIFLAGKPAVLKWAATR